MANLRLDSLPRQILAARAFSPGAKKVIRRYHDLLYKLNLPELSILLNSPPKTQTLKAYNIRKNLACLEGSCTEFLEAHETSFLGSCELQLLKSAPHWKVTVGDPVLTRLNKFRVRLLVHGLRWAGA